MRTRLPSPLLLSLILASLGLAACESDDHAQPDRPRGTATLFISPAGKPFHGQVGQPYPVAAWFAEADADHDGKLTREEFRADFAAFFKQLDTDHNGAIDGIELAAYEQNVAPEVLPRLAQSQGGGANERTDSAAGGNGPGGGQGGRRRRGGGQGGQGGGDGDAGAAQRQAEASTRRGPDYDGAPAFGLLNISEPVAGADTNFDGRVTLEEFLAAADRRFDQLDKDQKGYLTLATLPHTPQQIAVDRQTKK